VSKRQAKKPSRKCSCGRRAVIVCPVCGPECKTCYLAGVEGAVFGSLDDLGALGTLSWGAQRPTGHGADPAP
jgi:hypothetical protein